MAEGQGRSSNQGVKLLYIRDYLRKYTDKEHPKSATDIKEFLASKGIKADRKTIYNDILRLQMDFQEPIDYNPQKWGYYITEPQFEPHELRLMVDCVQAATFITDKEAQDISAKIKGLANIYDRESLNRQVYVKDRIHRVKDSVVRNADKIHQAITKELQISFRYFRYIADRTERKEYYKSQGSDRFIVSPRRMVWENGEYYLDVYRKENLFPFHFDVERLEDIQILETACDKREPPLPGDGSIPDDIYDGMFGKTHVVTIRFRQNAAWSVFDVFGSDIITIPLDPNHFTISIRARCGQELYMQIASFGCYAKILAPQDAVDGFKRFMQEQIQLYEDDTEPFSVWSQKELDDYFIDY